MENRDERYIVEYDTQTGEPIFSDGSRGARRNTGPEPERYEQPEFTEVHQEEVIDVAEVEPEPLPESNVYRFQNVEAVRPKKKEKKGWTMPKIALGAAMFGVIAAGCFFGVNAGLNALTGGDKPKDEIAQTKVEANTDNSKINNATASNASGVTGIVDAVMPSVVAIKETETQQNIYGQQYDAEGAGSGFIVKQDNNELLVATNSHVVSTAQKISVIFNDGEEVEAKVKGVSASNDIAVLTVDMTKMKDSTKKAVKVATLRSGDDIKVGEMAIAIGNANGKGQSVTVGYVSATDREFVIGSKDSNGNDIKRPMIQTDAAINPGNSGGPLIDAKGRVIGITTSKEFNSTDGRSVVGMNYAIPMSDAISIINDLMNREVLKDEEKGYLGITGQPIGKDEAKKYNMPEGVYVASVSETGAAGKAGIMQGDIIVSIDGTEVRDITAVKEIVNSKRVGTTIEVVVQRGNGRSYDEKKIKVTLDSKDTLDGLPQDDSSDSDDEAQPEAQPNQQPQIPGGFGGGDYQIIPWGY